MNILFYSTSRKSAGGGSTADELPGNVMFSGAGEMYPVSLGTVSMPDLIVCGC